MERKPLVEVAGTALLLFVLLASENMPDDAQYFTVRFASVGFAFFLARTALRVRPVGPWLAARPPLRWTLIAALATVVAVSWFWTAVASAVVLFLIGGVLSVEFFDDVARRASSLRAGARWPVGTVLAAHVAVAVLFLLHLFGVSAAQQTWPDSKIVSGFGMATLALGAAVLVLLGLAVAAAAGRGATDVGRRALYVAVFGYVAGWFIGYMNSDALEVADAVALPVLAIGVAVIEFFQILYEAPERVVAHGRVLPREALWDLLHTVAFAVLLLIAAFRVGGLGTSQAVFGMKAMMLFGAAAGVVLVPLARRRAAHPRDASLVADPVPVPGG